ncbi:hypothetical protein [Dehalobacter sp. 14DCB1]|uniref:hypothetical protein n=1 Tax=Dehalobacter sp. 14DCB1 TaxID=2070227 RepID=UPI00104B6C52|nr:hypothetical protein [Dehalobacter sp. 14DCB1]TCX51954.1 hypothetical protein C1I36_06450 [Dehalobacter sp. 14DCB1]TCX53014.1 hypothetical protein C1I38_08130 [Dehalobacter sp. 12DCB1]
MAHIETWYRCPTCNRVWSSQKEAITCRNSHPVKAERWAIGKNGKAVAVSYRGLDWALREADLSDFIHERAKQLEGGEKC